MKSIIQKNRVCYFCEREYGLDRHHAMHGTANRRLADQDGLTVYLCRECHRKLHDTEAGAEMDLKLKRDAETAWLNYYHKTVEDFIARYGRNYLKERGTNNG